MTAGGPGPRGTERGTGTERDAGAEGGRPVRGGSPRNVPALLLRLRQDGFSGTVRLSGTPGGTIHLRAGLIHAIETPGTPSVESALLKSGRVDDEGWAAGLTAVRDLDGLGAALVAQGRVGAAELEIVCAGTVFEGAFALALGGPGEWEVGDPAPTVLTRHGVEPQAVAEETARRLALVSRQWGSPAELARVKTRPAGRADVRAERLPDRYRAVLALANGRRTSRDLAFTLGRGLFGVMVDLIRMNDLGLVQWEGRAPIGRPSTAPRVVGDGRSPAPAPSPVPAASLPRRVPGGRPARQAGDEPRVSGGPEPTAPQAGL
ncbi:hypothetical protein [Streptomyces sp. NBC_01429]|uniref:hypothetical protein n=1 Tax=Streptomyces sp. NBC_01429 TaxID=2903862 RepID=UPI002E2BBA8C|nr:hypothetical protein [Streptomyces sp. NBC_01429]